LKFILAHDLARRRAVAAVAEAPAGYVVKVEEPKRDNGINAALHAMIGEIAKTREHAGSKHRPEVWKRLLTAAWGRATGQRIEVLPALDGAGVDVVFRHTSDLTQSECRELLSFIEAWHAETEDTPA